MRAKLTASGCLVISSDSELEAYALNCWIKENREAIKNVHEVKVAVDDRFPKTSFRETHAFELRTEPEHGKKYFACSLCGLDEVYIMRNCISCKGKPY